MGISSTTGLSSGINYNDLITKILELERQPINNLKKKQTSYNDKNTVYTDLGIKVSSLKTASDNLKTTTNFYAKKASVDDPTILDASATNSAAAGNYSVSAHSVAGKIQLAQNEQKSHTAGVAASTTVINSSGADKVFQYTYGGTQRTLTVATGTTLEGLRDTINNDSGNPGVTATIINTGTAYKLVLTGKDTGSTKSTSVDAGTTLDGTGGTTDFTSAAFTVNQAAQDAKLRINGIDIVRTSNTISDAITGVTLTLKKESTTAVAVSVTNDSDSIKKKVEDFVKAYNDVVTYVSAKSVYDSTTKVGGPLTGDGTARGIISSIRGVATSIVSGAPADLRTLADIGITTNTKDGTLTIDSTKLSDKIAGRLDDVAALFTTATTGIANQMWSYTDSVNTSTTGLIPTKQTGISSIVKGITDDITRMQNRLDKMEENLRIQFAGLEKLIGGLSAQGTFLSNQFK